MQTTETGLSLEGFPAFCTFSPSWPHRWFRLLGESHHPMQSALFFSAQWKGRHLPTGAQLSPLLFECPSLSRQPVHWSQQRGQGEGNALTIAPGGSREETYPKHQCWQLKLLPATLLELHSGPSKGVLCKQELGNSVQKETLKEEQI